jgi:hypothetical protein
MTLAAGQTGWNQLASCCAGSLLTICRSSLTSTHSPKSRSIFIPEADRARLKRQPLFLQSIFESYEQLALGYLAVMRKEDGALIGRCGIMELVSNPQCPITGFAMDGSGRQTEPLTLR